MADLTQLKQRIQQAASEQAPALLAELEDELARERRDGTDAETEYQILWLLLPLARRTGKLPRFRGELDRALDLAAGRTHQVLALAGLRSELEMQEGRYGDAERTLRQSLRLSEQVDDGRKGSLYLKLVRVLVHQERYEHAESMLREVLPVLEAGGQTALVASCRFLLGNVALRRRRLEEAARHHQQALALRQGLADGHGVCASLTALGTLSLAAGNYPQALDWLRRAEGEARRIRDPADEAYALYGLGRVLSRLGDHPAAAPKLRRCLELRQRIGDKEGQAVAQLGLAEIELKLGHTRRALELAQEAAFHLSLLAPSGTVGDAEQLLGRIHLAQRRGQEARRHLRSAIEHHGKHQDLGAVAVDRAWLLRMELEFPVREDMEPRIEDVAGYLETHPYPELGERLDFTLYLALEELARRGHRGGRIEGRGKHLERAFRSLMRKAGFLRPEQRHRYLFQEAEHDAILQAATAQGLSDPALGWTN